MILVILGIIGISGVMILNGALAQNTTTTDTNATSTATTTETSTTTTDMTTNATSALITTPQSLFLYPLEGTTPAPMVIDVGSDGIALIRGRAVTVSPNSVMILAWGGLWTVRTNALSQVYSLATNSFGNMTGISVGDFVGALGRVANDQILTIDATLVRDWTTTPFIEGSTSGTGTTTDQTGTSSPVNTTPSDNATSSSGTTSPQDNTTTSTDTNTGGNIIY